MTGSDESSDMSSDMRPPSGGRRPPTIDLKATEVEASPATDAAATPPAGPATQASDAPPTAPADEAGAPRPSDKPAATSQTPGMDPASAAPGASPHEPTAPPRRGSIGWLPLIGAGIAGGAVVAAALGIAGLFSDTGSTSLDARLAGLEQRLRDIAARPLPLGADAGALDDLRGRLAKLEAAAPRPAANDPATDPALANRISAIEGGVKALDENVGILGRRSDEAVATAREARQRADATASALVELTQKVARPGAPLPAERSELEALANRVAAVERGEKAVEAELAKRLAAGSGDRSVRLALAAAALQATVARGDPFAAELATVKSLAADSKSDPKTDPKSLAALEPFAGAGVPTAAGLSRELTELAPALLQAAGAPPREGGFLERLQLGAEKLVRIRPVEEIAGSDPAAIIARIEVKASHADLAGALAELAKLPPTARAPAEAWITKAEARTSAIEASRRLAADALAGLGK
jgi:hypothetical protein